MDASIDIFVAMISTDRIRQSKRGKLLHWEKSSCGIFGGLQFGASHNLGCASVPLVVHRFEVIVSVGTTSQARLNRCLRAPRSDAKWSDS
jgi:hypothetical protein